METYFWINLYPILSHLNPAYFIFLLSLQFFSLAAQMHPDPFTQSSRLPDLSVGFGVMQNTQDTFQVLGKSVLINGDYYDFVSNYSLGIEYARNLDRLGQHETEITNPTRLEKAREFQGLTYDQSVVAIRAGKVFKNNFILIGSIGIEFLKQYKFYEREQENSPNSPYFIATGVNDMLSFYKFSIMYKVRRISLESFIARRAIGVTLHYYINQ